MIFLLRPFLLGFVAKGKLRKRERETGRVKKQKSERKIFCSVLTYYACQNSKKVIFTFQLSTRHLIQGLVYLSLSKRERERERESESESERERDRETERETERERRK